MGNAGCEATHPTGWRRKKDSRKSLMLRVLLRRKPLLAKWQPFCHFLDMNGLDEELTSRLKDIREQGLYRELRRIDSPQGPRIEMDGKSLLNFSSNDYLGLANDPALKRSGHAGRSRNLARARALPA